VTRPRYIVILIAVLGCLCGADDLKQLDGRLTIEHATGRTEHVVVRWTAVVLADRRETGGPATPLQGKWTDDRECHWTVRTRVSRRLLLRSSNGEELDWPGSGGLDPATDGGAGLRELRSSHQNCNEAEAGMRRDFEVARVEAKRALQKVIETDRDSLETQLRKRPGVRAVTFEWDRDPQR